MTALHPDVEARKVSLLAAFAPLTLALMAATVKAREADVKLDGEGRPKPMKNATEDQSARAGELIEARENFDRAVNEYLTATAMYLTAVSALPRTVYDAAAQTASFQVDYETAATIALELCERWRMLDVESARVKVAVAARLTQGDPDNGIKGLSASAARDAASGDPEYTTLKDKIAAALNDKDRSEVERDVSYQKLLTARSLLNGLVQISASRAGAPVLTLSQEPAKEGATSSFDSNGVKSGATTAAAAG